MRKPISAGLGALMLWLWAGGPAAGADFSDRVRQPVDQAIAVQQATQQARDDWAGAKAARMADLEAAQRRNRELTAAYQEVQSKLAHERTAAARSRRQLAEISRFGQELGPFLVGLHEDLAALLENDGPLLQEERRTRLDRLADTLADPDLPISEKYRKAMEALLIEAEYGSTIEVNTESIRLDGESRVARILRMGRVALFFETLDGGRAGEYDPATGAWRVLTEDHHKAIRTALEIGAKRRSATVVELPLGRIVPP